jgi:hypothetical protein
VSAPKESANKEELERKRWLYRACHSRAALEIYLHPFADAQKFNAQLESRAAQLKRETSDPAERPLDRPFFKKGGFGGEKLHRSTVRVMLELARENAFRFFLREQQIREAQMWGETMPDIANDLFVRMNYRAVWDSNGDYFRLIGDLVDEDAKPLKKILHHASRYQVALVQEAILELVDEADKRYRAAKAVSYMEIDNLRCFVPLKKQVKARTTKIFRKLKIGKGQRDSWIKLNPAQWSKQMWTKVFRAAGLADLPEARGLHRRKTSR